MGIYARRRGTIFSGSVATADGTVYSHYINPEFCASLTIHVIIAGTVSATLENSVDDTGDGTGTWLKAPGATTTYTSTDVWSVTDPVGLYRVKLTSASFGTVTVKYEMSRRQGLNI